LGSTFSFFRPLTGSILFLASFPLIFAPNVSLSVLSALVVFPWVRECGLQGEVGIACFSVENPVLVLCQFSDSATYPRTLTKLLAINPTQILLPGIMGRDTMDGKL